MLGLLLLDRATPGGEHGVCDVAREPLVHGPADHLIGRSQEVELGVDLEPAVDAVDPDAEDRVGDRRHERPCGGVARRGPIEPLVGGRRCMRPL